MLPRDIFRFINELDDPTTQRLIERLEFRGKDPRFSQWIKDYLAMLPLSSIESTLDMGCGTGVAARALARSKGFQGKVTGIDQSRALVKAARRFSEEEGSAHAINFQVGDVHALDFPHASFDLVIAHTLLSHVTDPAAVLKQIARMVRPGGTSVIFDGDYASLTFGCLDQALGKAMDHALIELIVNNPRVMRDMPRLLKDAGLQIQQAIPHVYLEIGAGNFFTGFMKTYAPLVAQSGLLPADKVEEWTALQHKALAGETFFAACNYYTYVVLSS